MNEAPNTLKDLPTFPKGKRVCIDVETASFDPAQKALDPWKGHRIAGISVSTFEGAAWYFPIRHRDDPANLPIEQVLRWLQHLVDDPTREVFGHNFKFDLRFMRMDGINVKCKVADTLVLARLVDNLHDAYDLDSLGQYYFGEGKYGKDAVLAYLRGIRSLDFGDCPARIMAPYAKRDTRLTYELRKRLEQDLPEYSKTLWETEKRVTGLLHDAEYTGTRIDVMHVKRDWHGALKRMLEVKDEISAIAGWDVDPSKDADRTELLINQLGIPVTERTPTGRPRWTKDVMDKLVVPADKGEAAQAIGKLFRAWSFLSFFIGTFLEGWASRVDDAGYLHTDFKQSGTKTGRFASTDPNLNNVPPEAERYVIPPDGDVIVGGDYSQVEYRMFADYTRDPLILGAYTSDAGADFHQYLADQLGVPRQFAKMLNFAFLYGMGKEKLMTQMMAVLANATGTDKTQMMDRLRMLAWGSGEGRTAMARTLLKGDETGEIRALAEKIYDEYHARYPSIRQFSDRVLSVGRTRKWLRGKSGRRYLFDPSRYDSLAKKKRMGPHKGVNYLIQGSCSDLLRERLVACVDGPCKRYGARLFMSVYDSVYFYVSRANAPAFYGEMLAALQDAPGLAVPIIVEGCVATRTLNAKVTPETDDVDGVLAALALADAKEDASPGVVAVSQRYRKGSHYA